MSNTVVYGLAALSSLIPACVLALRPRAERPPAFWQVLLVAVAGTAAWTAVQADDSWNTGLSLALWVTISASLALFAGVAAVARQGRQEFELDVGERDRPVAHGDRVAVAIDGYVAGADYVWHCYSLCL